MKKVIKWLKRIFLVLLSLLVLTLFVGFIYEQVSRSNVEHDFKPKGKLVDVGGHKLHIISKGTGSPTVVLESGLDAAGSLSWSAIHDSIAQFTRVVAYDRAGVLWSERGETLKTGKEIGKELYTLLKKSNEQGPYVLVGHSFAGITLRPFLDAHRKEVLGLIFVDASHPEQFERFPEEANESMQPPNWLIKMASNVGVVRLMGSDQQLPGTKASDSCNVLMKARLPVSMQGLADEMTQMEMLAKESQSAGKLDSLPLIVITANHPDRYKVFANKELRKQNKKIWLELQRDHLKLSTNSEQVFANGSNHYIQLEQPELVIAAIKKLVNEVRK